jgi:hypothetical protein
MNRLLDFVILALAVWRFSSMLVNEDGPLHIFHKLRYMVGMRYDEQSIEYPTTPLSDLFACVWCMSVWVGIGATVVYLVSEAAAVSIAMPFALSAVTIMIEHKLGGD